MFQDIDIDFRIQFQQFGGQIELVQVQPFIISIAPQLRFSTVH